jgi:hypothetical protein
MLPSLNSSVRRATRGHAKAPRFTLVVKSEAVGTVKQSPLTTPAHNQKVELVSE